MQCQNSPAAAKLLVEEKDLSIQLRILLALRNLRPLAEEILHISSIGMFDVICSDLKLLVEKMDIIELRSLHKSICEKINSIFRGKRIKYCFASPKLSKLFLQCMRNIIQLYSNVRNRSEMRRYWKVKRVQIAKLFLDFCDFKLTRKEFSNLFKSVFINGITYSIMKKEHSTMLYYYTLMLKCVYTLIILDHHPYGFISFH